MACHGPRYWQRRRDAVSSRIGRPLPPVLPAGHELPSIAQRAANLAGALVDFAADGFHLVDQAELDRRLAICRSCTDRRENTCGLCGCFLRLKAQGRAWHCPAGKW